MVKEYKIAEKEDVLLIQNKYWQQKARIKESMDFERLRKAQDNGCPLLPRLFKSGLQINGEIQSSIAYADNRASQQEH